MMDKGNRRLTGLVFLMEGLKIGLLLSIALSLAKIGG